MKDSIVTYYKNRVTSYNLVFKHIPFTYFVTSVIICNFALSSFLFISNIILIINKIFTPFIYYFLVSLIVLVLCMIFFNHRAKKVLINKYNLSPKQIFWRTREFEEFRIKMMVDYLKLNEIYSEKKISFLKQMLINSLIDKKMPSLIAPGLLLAFLVPIWSEFVKFTFQKSVTSFDSAIHTFIGISIILIIVIVIFNFGKALFTEIRELFSMNDTVIIKYLINFLDDILLMIPEEDKDNVSKS